VDTGGEEESGVMYPKTAGEPVGISDLSAIKKTLPKNLKEVNH